MKYYNLQTRPATQAQSANECKPKKIILAAANLHVQGSVWRPGPASDCAGNCRPPNACPARRHRFWGKKPEVFAPTEPGAPRPGASRHAARKLGAWPCGALPVPQPAESWRARRVPGPGYRFRVFPSGFVAATTLAPVADKSVPGAGFEFAPGPPEQPERGQIFPRAADDIARLHAPQAEPKAARAGPADPARTSVPQWTPTKRSLVKDGCAVNCFAPWVCWACQTALLDRAK